VNVFKHYNVIIVLVIGLGLEALSPEEKEELERLMHKAGMLDKTYGSNPVDPDDPPEEKAEIGPRIVEPDVGVEDWATGIRAKARKWKERTLRPKKDPIKSGIEAEPKFADKIKKVAELGLRKKALEKWTFDEWGATVAATRPEDFESGALKKRYKMARKIKAQYDARVYAATKLDAMPVATDADREAKMTANLRIMRKLKEFMAGIIGLDEFKRFVDEQTA